MSDQLVCITNTMPDVRPCTIRDSHTEACKGNHDGWEYRLVTTGYDKARKRPIVERVATGKPCKGCVPQPARVGLLCMSCWLNLEQALADWPRFEQMIRGVERAVRADGRGGSAVGYVPIPGTALSVEECVSYLTAEAWSNARLWVSSEKGARNAVLFTRAAQVAYRSHPIEEKPHRVRRVRCPACGQLSFVRNPPDGARASITVTCQTATCGKTIREGDVAPRYDVDGLVIEETEKLTVIAEIERKFEKVAEIEEGRSKRA